MHDYLKAIGFDIQSKKELKELLNDIKTNYTRQTIVSRAGQPDYCELQKEYGEGIGIRLCGELDENDDFESDYYFPYYTGSGITTHAGTFVNKKIEKAEYMGICEDPRVGISLIFHLQNGIEFMRERQAILDTEISNSVTFSGLALSGKILLPVSTHEKALKSYRPSYSDRKIFLDGAEGRNPNSMMLETLNIFDIYSQVSRRVIDEDLFTIVDTYFMPYGIECDLYSIMGKILAVRKRKNILTNEPLYQLKVDVNEIKFDVCVPAKELMGEPKTGRRFRGTIWLQGTIHF